MSSRQNSFCIIQSGDEENVMERRDFLKLAIGLAAGATALAASAQAAPLLPHPLLANGNPQAADNTHPAVTTGNEVDSLEPQQVRWGHGHHWGWHHRHWGWRHRHWGWHHRHWGWRHRHWGWRRRWHHHHWRRYW
jgi:hypothetical protein